MESNQCPTNLQRQIERKALAEVKEAIPDIWKTLDEEHKLQVKLSITKAVEEVSELERKFERDPSILVEDAISHIAPHRRQLIKTSFNIQTYQAIINNENNTVSFYKDGDIVLPSIPLDSVENYKRAILLVNVSIIVETVIFMLNIAGLAVPMCNARMATQKLAAKLANTERFRKILTKMADDANSGDFQGLSWDMISLSIALYKRGMLWDIVHDLLSSMSLIDYGLAVASFSAYLIALIGSGGAIAIAALQDLSQNFLICQHCHTSSKAIYEQRITHTVVWLLEKTLSYQSFVFVIEIGITIVITTCTLYATKRFKSEAV